MEYSTETGTPILTDEELVFLSESTPCTEGSPLIDFMSEAAEVVKSLSTFAAGTTDMRVRLLLLMRGFYFLGVLRGGEAYRGTLEDKDLPPLPFDLSVSCTELFAGDLEDLTTADLDRVCAAVGFKIS